MNTFKHKSLYAAVAGLSALGATGVAQAVSVNHDGLGQVLIYPYFTVRGVGIAGATELAAYNSLLSVVNSTNSAKAVKVRFLEGKNSREILDFNLYLSKHDVWTAAIIPLPSITGTPSEGAGIFTADQSCTTPAVSKDSTHPTAFVNYAYVGDTGGDSLDRTKEGYVEIIEMADVIGTTAVAVTHVGGVPPGCASSALSDATVLSNTVPGTGGLFGSMTLINVLKGEDFGYDPTVLDGFSSTVRWFPPADVKPTLADVNPKTSVVVAGSNVLITDWSATSNNVDAVSAVLMHNNVYNEFVLEPSTASGTDWVLTFPTKRDYVFVGSGAAQKLFESNFNNGSCDAVSLTFYDREEREVTVQSGFSPPPPTKFDSFCWEANVVSYRYPSTKAAPSQSAVLGSKNFYSQGTDFANGWVAINFNSANVAPGRHRLIGGGSTVFNTKTGQTIGLLSTTFNGLPVIGFAAITYENGTLPGTGPLPIQSNYGNNFNHKVTTSVQ